MPSPHPPRALARPLLRDAADLTVIAIIALLLVVAALLRQDFIGDGVRHLDQVLRAETPSPGEPRWVWFPVLAWLVVRPWAALGAVGNVEGAIQPLLWLSVLAGVIYLLALRAWLLAEGVEPRSRAAALLLAGACIPFLRLFSDVAEVQIGAAFVVVALAFARVSARKDPPGASRSLLLAAAAISAASLLYQGLLFAAVLLPLVVSREVVRRRRMIALALLLLALSPLAATLTRLAAGDTPGVAIETTVKGERNPRTRAFMTEPSLRKYVVAAVAGPAQGIVGLRDYAGLTALVAKVRGAGSRIAGLLDAARLLAGVVLFGALLWLVVRERGWALLVAMLALMVLPIVRNQQYAYVKFFVLWPVIVALIACRLEPRLMLPAGIAVLLSNGLVLAGDLAHGRRLHAAVGSAYAGANSDTCWFTSGWGPPQDHRWPGTSAGMLAVLATGEDPLRQAERLSKSLRRCFCGSQAVWTDTTASSEGLVQRIAGHFKYEDVSLAPLLFVPALGESISGPPLTIYRYSDRGRLAVCEHLSGGRPPR